MVPKVSSHRREPGRNHYTVDLMDGRTAEIVLFRRGSSFTAEGGEVTGCPSTEQVSTFREAVDWLSRFVEHDGSPRPGFLSPEDPSSPAVPADDEKEHAETA